MLNEERSFVILMAYDYRTMKKGTMPMLLWSIRFSVRAPGNFFTTVLPAMSRTSENYFGRNLDGLKFEIPEIHEGKVEVGQPTVVGHVK